MPERQPADDPYAKFLGIDTETRPPDHYAILGLDPLEPDVAKIDQAAKKRAARLHQLAGGPERAAIQELMGQVAVARRTLTDPDQKALYDDRLRNPIAIQDEPKPETQEESGGPDFSIAVGQPASRPKRETRVSTEPSGKARPWVPIASAVMLIVIVMLAYNLIARSRDASNSGGQGATSGAAAEAQRTEILKGLGKSTGQGTHAMQSPINQPAKNQAAKNQAANQQPGNSQAANQPATNKANAAKSAQQRRAKRRAAAAKRKEQQEKKNENAKEMGTK